MSKKEEYWDLWNQDGTLAGTIRRGDGMIPPDQYHLTVEVIPTDGKGHLLVIQRALQKRLGSGLYEFPAGSVLSGEAPDKAARRELLEETGLKTRKLYKLTDVQDPGIRRSIYVAVIPGLLDKKIQLQEEEAMDYRFVTVEQWLDMLVQGIFNSNRSRLYTEEVYTAIENYAGTDNNSDKSKTKRKLRSTTLFCKGTETSLTEQEENNE